ncbi:MAG: peptide deformylase [Ignavibacteriales bacterium]|nr:peptide deformylase [Ignavibacteriales bacterium]
MSILPITLYGDNILRKKVSKAKSIDDKTIALISNMFETMHNAHGIGLAANQVGANKAIFIVDLTGVEEYENFKPIVFINPNINKYSDEKCIIEEGCLSIPDIRGEVERPSEIEITYFDTNFKEQTIHADKLLARVIQHEYDHLRGIYFTDLLPAGEQKRLKKSLTKIKNRKIEVDYPITHDLDYQLK